MSVELVNSVYNNVYGTFSHSPSIPPVKKSVFRERKLTIVASNCKQEHELSEDVTIINHLRFLSCMGLCPNKGKVYAVLPYSTTRPSLD